MSPLSKAPRDGSYKPPTLGRFRSSNKIGFTICLTDILLMSSEVKNENEILLTDDGIALAIFMFATVRELRKEK